jgi:hypothetical protein
MARRSYKTVGKAAAVLAVVLLLSLGLCGANDLLQNGHYATGPGLLGLIGLLGIIVSTLALVVTGLVVFVVFLLNLFDRD